MWFDDSAPVPFLQGDCDSAIKGSERLVALQDVGCHACEHVGELTGCLAHCSERLHSEEANLSKNVL